jgi:hypothetical protein
MHLKKVFPNSDVDYAKIAPQYRTKNLNDFGKILIQLELDFGLVGCMII